MPPDTVVVQMSGVAAADPSLPRVTNGGRGASLGGGEQAHSSHHSAGSSSSAIPVLESAAQQQSLCDFSQHLSEGDLNSITRDERLAYAQTSLAFQDLRFAIPDKSSATGEQLILSPTSGAFAAGSMVAFMGPSGSGKTTLLDMLAQKKTSPYTGSVWLNGRSPDKLFNRVTSYVPQQDIMPPYWTVAEAVMFNHELRIDADISRDTRLKLTLEVLSFFGLETVKDTFIGDARVRGISGGQRRRVTLARGFVGGSQIVFADEPTSGLSATDAETCVRAMAGASKRIGITFVVVIHQPRVEVAEMFDHLLLLTAHPGRVVYNGTFIGVAGYFADAGHPPPKIGNPADFYLDIITPGARGACAEKFVGVYESSGQRAEVERQVSSMLKEGGKEIIELIAAANQKRGQMFSGKALPVRNSPYAVGFWKQFSTLMRRKLALTARDKGHLKVRFLMAALQGLIIGVAFMDIGSKQPVQQLSFMFMLLQMGALSNLAIMPELIAQRLVFKFETSDSLYSSWAAVMVDNIVNYALGIGGNFLTSIIMYSLSGLPFKYFSTLYLWSFICFMVMTNFFKVVSAITPTPAESMQVAMPGLMITIIFNNFFVNKATAPFFMKWAIYVSPMAWSIEQIATGIYGDDDGLVKLYGYDGSSTQTARAISVLIFEMFALQCLHLFCLGKFNNISR